MTQERPDDAMLEIGDIDDDLPPSATESAPSPRVVIEYRDRGIPWMLVPPLLVLSASIAAVTVYNINAKRDHRRPPPPTVEASLPPVDSPPTASLPSTGLTSVPPVASVVEPPPVENPPGLPKSAEKTQDPVPASSLTIEAPDPSRGSADPMLSDLALTLFPKIPALGFDPSAIEAAPMPIPPDSAAPRDHDLAPVAQPDRGDGLGFAPGRATLDQADQVDPNLLPPDPRKAQADRRRRAAEDRRKTEADRFRFHAELNAIWKQMGRRSAPRIHELVQTYDAEIPPAAFEQAQKALGRTGLYAGADTSERIALLRRLGFPEPAILGAVFDLESRYESKLARNAPTRDDLYIRSALVLLNNPPNRPPTSARAVSRPRAGIGAKAGAAEVPTTPPTDPEP